MSLWQSYRNLSPRTRLIFAGGILAWGSIGLLLTDRAERSLGLVPTEEDKKKLRESMPIVVR